MEEAYAILRMKYTLLVTHPDPTSGDFQRRHAEYMRDLATYKGGRDPYADNPRLKTKEGYKDVVFATTLD